MDVVGAAAAQRWTDELRGWGLPDEIVAQAPESPWVHPVESFRPGGDPFVETPSRCRALEVLSAWGTSPSVLDVGCGGGRASLALVPPATLVVGIDRQREMLDVFAAEAHARGVSAEVVCGEWPAVAACAPQCDLVVCHHVLFNVPELVPFVTAASERARRRVVIELSMAHPLANLSPAWEKFWGLQRPTAPTALDAADVLREMGIDVRVERFEAPDPKADREVTAADVRHTRVRLCLPASRDDEIREFLTERPTPPREMVTLWWDV